MTLGWMKIATSITITYSRSLFRVDYGGNSHITSTVLV